MTAAVRTQLAVTVGLALLGVQPRPVRYPPFTGQHAATVRFPWLSLVADLITTVVRPLWPVIDWLRRASTRALYGTAFGVLFVAALLFTVEVHR